MSRSSSTATRSSPPLRALSDDTGYFVINDGQIVTIFYKEADGSEDEEEEVKSGTIGGDEVQKSDLKKMADLKNEVPGAYVLAEMPTDHNDDIGGKIEQNIFFVFNLEDAAKATLTIKNEKNKTMYRETPSEDMTVNNTDKNYPMGDKALDKGTYTWTIVSENKTVASGEFIIG